MSTVTRTDNSLIGRWWWTVDRWTLAALVGIIGVGALLTLAATPPVAERLGYDTYHFVKRQFLFLPFGALCMLAVSLLAPKGVRRLAVVMFLGFLTLTLLTLIAGAEVKGASRWLRIGGLSLQPSEFLKPSLAVLCAWMLAERCKDTEFPGYLISSGLCLAVLGVLALQPDVGMSIVVATVWGRANVRGGPAHVPGGADRHRVPGRRRGGLSDA